MNKKIILLVAILLIIAVVFVACKGKGDTETTTESTTESTAVSTTAPTTAADEPSSGITLDDFSADEDLVMPNEYDEGDVIIVGGQENSDGEDSIGWNEIIGE